MTVQEMVEKREERRIRLMLARDMLCVMLRNQPLDSIRGLSKQVLSERAFEWADAMLAAEKKP